MHCETVSVIINACNLTLTHLLLVDVGVVVEPFTSWVRQRLSFCINADAAAQSSPTSIVDGLYRVECAIRR